MRKPPGRKDEEPRAWSPDHGWEPDVCPLHPGNECVAAFGFTCAVYFGTPPEGPNPFRRRVESVSPQYDNPDETITINLGDWYGKIDGYRRALAGIPAVTAEEAERAASLFLASIGGAQREAARNLAPRPRRRPMTAVQSLALRGLL